MLKSQEERKRDLIEAIRTFHTSARGPMDYQALLLAGAASIRQGSGLSGTAFSETIEEAINAL